MPINPFRLRLLDILDALPQAMPMPVALERTHTREALSTIEHLAIEMSLQTHSLCLVHSTVPELQANAILECALGPASDARGSAVFQRLLGFNFREAPRQCASLSIDASRDRFVLSTPINLAEATADDLVALMLSSVRRALHWRASGFAPTPEAPTEAAPANTAWHPADSMRA